jgi:hypothetical protein
VREVAQTNLQLYEQLLEYEWDVGDLAVARRAYDLACQLFSGRYDSSGKPFVDHLVGAASVVLTVDGRPELVTAALVHAAYQVGDFGPFQTVERRRARLRDAVGPEPEELVFAYTSWQWNGETIRGLAAGTRAHSPRTRDLLLLRLAHEVDARTDRGAGISDPELVDVMADLALDLGYSDLADLLDRVQLDEGLPPFPAVLSSPPVAQVRLAPSYCRSPAASLEAALAWLCSHGTRAPGAHAISRVARSVRHRAVNRRL